MTLSRTTFLMILALLFLGPFVFYKASWIAGARHTTGAMWFEGHTLELQEISSHPVIRFELNHRIFFFNGNLNFDFKVGQSIPVLYQPNDPSDAKIDSFASLWLDTIVYMLLPLGILLVIALTPERFGPLIPRNCLVQIGMHPLIKLIPKSVDVEPGQIDKKKI